MESGEWRVESDRLVGIVSGEPQTPCFYQIFLFTLNSPLILMIARKFIISGEVQGVGFRFFAQRSSARHQVRGYVKNLKDGRVEVLAEGLAKAVEEFRLDLAAGPTHSQVWTIEELVIEPSGLYSAFRIER